MRQFPIDALKIDRSLINEMLTDRATSAKGLLTHAQVAGAQ